MGSGQGQSPERGMQNSVVLKFKPIQAANCPLSLFTAYCSVLAFCSHVAVS
jgi:hypothetical protein